MNSASITNVLADKNIIEFVYGKVLAENAWIRIPNTIGGSSAGNYFDQNRKPATKEQLIDSLEQLTGEYIIKPSVGENSGHGVHLLLLERGIDLKTGQSISDVIDSYGKDFIIQERIVEHSE